MAYLFVILKNMIYGSTVFFTGGLLSSADVLDVLSLRFLFSSIVILLLWSCKILKINFKGKNLKYIFLTAVFEPGLYYFFETMGISLSSDLTVAVIIAMIPIATVIFGRIILKEKSTLLQKLSLILSILGVVYIVSKTSVSNEKDSVLGIIFLILTVASGSLFTVFSRKTSKKGEFSPMEITCFSAFFGAVVFNGINIVRHAINHNLDTYFNPFFSLENIIAFFVLSVVSSLVATGMNNFSLSKISVLKATVFSGVSTLTTIAIGVIFNHEEIHQYQVIGTVAILLGVLGVNFFAAREKSKS